MEVEQRWVGIVLSSSPQQMQAYSKKRSCGTDLVNESRNCFTPACSQVMIFVKELVIINFTKIRSVRFQRNGEAQVGTLRCALQSSHEIAATSKEAGMALIVVFTVFYCFSFELPFLLFTSSPEAERDRNQSGRTRSSRRLLRLC